VGGWSETLFRDERIMANNDTYILTGNESVDAGLLPPTNLTLTTEPAAGGTFAWFFLATHYVQIRAYSFKELAYHTYVFSSNYVESNEIKGPSGGLIKVKVNYTPAPDSTGIVCGHKVLLCEICESWKSDG